MPQKLWSRKFLKNLMYMFKLHYPAPQNAFSAFMLPSGGRGTFIVATFTIGQNWIAGLQQCILNLNCAKKQEQYFGPSDCFDIYDSSPEFKPDPKQNSLQIHIVLWGEHRNRKEFHEMLSQCFQLDSYKAPVKCECIL